MSEEDFKPVLCDRCPFVYHCPVEQSDALRHVREKEGTILSDTQMENFQGALELANKAAESCPCVILIRESRLTESKKFEEVD